MLSRARRISSSYSCDTPCPPSFDRAWLNPDPTTVGVDEVEIQEALEIDVDGYGNEYGPFSANVVDWWSADPSIATVYWGQVSGVAVGTTSATATVEYPLYFWDSGTMDCSLYGTQQQQANGQVSVEGTISLGSVSFTHPNPPVIRSGQSATLRVIVTASSVPAGTPIKLEISTVNVSGVVGLTISQPAQILNVGGGTSASVSTQHDISFEATSNPSELVNVTGRARLVRVDGTPSNIRLGTGMGTERDSTNVLQIQPQ